MDKITQKLLLIFKNRKAIIVFLFFILTGLSFPTHFASAWYEYLIGAFTQIPAIMVGLILLVWIGLTTLLAGLSGALLKWVISGELTSLSYTNPAGNPVIEAGLSVTQGLVNMILVLVLVYIAIVTILRLEKYQTKKLLASFILVALLVNFAPLICGVIVDATNILMNFFLKGLNGGQILTNTSSALWGSIVAGFEYKTFLVNFGVGKAQGAAFNINSPSGQLQILMNMVVLGVANLVLFLVLGLFTFLFVARYIAIWVLVILSPIAFAFRILPDTKKYWDLWWSQFIQWTTIGITAGFFLLLAEKFASLTDAIRNTSEAPGIGSKILPYAVPIAFYIIALIFSVQTAAKGASAVISIAKIPAKGLGWVGKRAAGRGWKTVQDKLLVREGAKGLISSLDQAAGSGGKWGKVAKAVRWAVPDAARKYSENLAGINEIKKKFESESSVALTDGLRSKRFTGIEAAAVMMTVRERNDGEDIMQSYLRSFDQADKGKYAWLEEYKKDPAAVYNKLFNDQRFIQDPQMIRALEVLEGAGAKGKMLRNEPRLARIGIKDKKGQLEAIEKAIRDAKPSDISGWEKQVLEDEETMEVFMATKTEASFATAAGLKDGIRRARTSFNRNLTKFLINDANKLVTHTNGKTGTYAATQNGYFDYLEDKYDIRRGQLGYRKMLKDPRKRARTAGWDDLQDLRAAPVSPGPATVGGSSSGTSGTPPSGEPTASAGTRPGRNPKARRRTPPPGRG